MQFLRFLEGGDDDQSNLQPLAVPHAVESPEQWFIQLQIGLHQRPQRRISPEQGFVAGRAQSFVAPYFGQKIPGIILIVREPAEQQRLLFLQRVLAEGHLLLKERLSKRGFKLQLAKYLRPCAFKKSALHRADGDGLVVQHRHWSFRHAACIPSGRRPGIRLRRWAGFPLECRYVCGVVRLTGSAVQHRDQGHRGQGRLGNVMEVGCTHCSTGDRATGHLSRSGVDWHGSCFCSGSGVVLDRRSDVVMRIRGLMLLSLLLILALGARIDAGTTLQDLVRLKGHDRVFLQGLGIVVGLEGTGDTSKNSWVAAKPYAMLLENLGDPVSSLDQLEKADAYAIVYVSMEVPAFGAIDGDQLDVTIETVYNATSLKGGRLVFSPLRLPAPHAANPPIMAFAQGAVILEGTDLTSGRIRNGGQMVRDIKANPISGDRVQLILKDEYAGWPMADRLAGIINANFDFTGVDRIAGAENAKAVHVLLPTADRAQPAPFLAALLSTPVDPSLIDVGARIVVNERTGTILVNEDVEIGPVAVAHDGLTITSLSPGAGAQGTDGAMPADWVGIDARQDGAGSSMHLNTLLEALRRFNVPVKEQIEILYELRRSGALHAEIIDE